jgi:NADH:ubiquinone oxidoreductase subunit 2 (subunit N)
MIIETIKLNEMGIFPELFFGICIIYLFLHGTFISYNSRFNFPLIETSMSYLAILVLIMISFLFVNDSLNELNYVSFNNTIANDYLSFASKLIINISAIIFLLMVQEHLLTQKINHFEYLLIFLFALLGLFLLCSSNDLIIAYLSIELQSLAFYLLAAFKKNSTYSIEAGLKYFVLGAFSSGLFLFGSSLIYGISGSITFTDFKDLFYWSIPGCTPIVLHSLSLLDRLDLLTNKIRLIGIDQFSLSEYDCNTLLTEFEYFNQLTVLDKSQLQDFVVKTNLYNELGKYFEAGLFSQINSQFFNERGIHLKEHSDIFNDYSIIFHNFAKKLLWQTIAKESENSRFLIDSLIYDIAGKKIEMGIENQNSHSSLCYLKILAHNMSSYFNDKYPKNSELLTVYTPYFIVPDDYQIKKYFYIYKAFDITLLRFALTFILISLFFKLAIAPFHSWSPAIYENSPSSTTFFFVVVPKLALFVFLLKIFYFGFFGFIDSWRYYIIIGAISSIIVGCVAGLEQRKLKSLLAYSSISHMGYLLISFSSGNLNGLQMLLNYLIIYMISGLCVWSIFVLTKLKNNYSKKQNKDLGDFVLLHKSNKILALILTISLFSIAGLPPTIGFLVKMSIFLSAIESSIYFISLISILFTAISAFYYIRIIKILYYEPVLVGKLYYPITTQKAFVTTLLFYSFFFFFINPTVLYLTSYKIVQNI